MSSEPVTGSCLCGAIKYSFSGAPLSRTLCHCLDCRKISGSHYADNALLSTSQLTILSGTPKTYTVSPKPIKPKAKITSHFCGDCGSTLWRTGEGFEGYVSVRLGTLDDTEWVGRSRPGGQYFEERRVGWLPDLLGKKESAETN